MTQPRQEPGEPPLPNEGQLGQPMAKEAAGPPDPVPALSPTKRRLLELQRRQAAGGPRSVPVRPRSAGDRGPLSFSQERLWFLSQYEKAGTHLVRSAHLHLAGPLDVGALERSLDAIVLRHEILRTVYRSVDGKPRQDVADYQPFHLSLIDLREQPPTLRIQMLASEAMALRHQVADPQAGPVFASALVRLSPEEHVLLLAFHHICSDGWSDSVFVRELEALYAGATSDSVPGLPALPIQYADFAAWQRERLTDRYLALHLDYWSKALRAPLPVLELPADRPRPPLQAFSGGRETLVLAPELLCRLETLGRTEQATLFMVLLAGFMILLRRLSQQEDMVVGIPVSGRNRLETEPLIGCFVNSLAIRTTFKQDATCRDSIGQIREAVTSALAHQEMPLEKLVSALGLQRDPSRSPLFQVMFQLRNLPSAELDVPGLSARRWKEPGAPVLFDMSWDLERVGDSLACHCDYSTGLFESATAARWLRHYERILELMAQDAAQPVGTLPFLTDAERHQLLLDCNATQSEHPTDKCIHRLFEEQAKRTPDSIAVEFGPERLTYRELNAQSDRLASQLAGLGVKPEVVVALFLERSVEAVVCMLAVWKTGGLYLPLDSEVPPRRLEQILASGKPSVVLTHRALASLLPTGPWQAVCLDEPLAQNAARPPLVAAKPHHGAYAIFTSGSTGEPKGVLVEHRNLANLIAWHHRAYGLCPGDRTTQVANLSFDASVWELWPALTSGATVCFVSEDLRADVKQLIPWLARERITVCFLPTPLAEVALSECWPSHSRLRYLLTGGNQLRMRPPVGCPFKLVNHYGPTEATVLATACEIGPDSAAARLPPIGRPISNVAVYVLDQNRQPVPLGIPGELWIGGQGVARGYVSQPELTAARFLKNPFMSGEDCRIYRTGDLCRWRPDGELEFLGRLDDQVKIRGYRVEPGEVEAAFRRHPDIIDVAVMIRAAAGGVQGLAAYLVPRHNRQISLLQLRQDLEQWLPEYMMPGTFALVERIPLNASGKVDRRALQGLAERNIEARIPLAAPQTELEHQLAAIWRELLGVSSLGLGDNFFDLGGHSLLAMQVASRIRQTLHVEMPVRFLFEAPTLAQLAARLEILLWSSSSKHQQAGEGQEVIEV